MPALVTGPLELPTFTDRRFTFFATPYVLPPMVPATCVPCPKQSLLLGVGSPVAQTCWLKKLVCVPETQFTKLKQSAAILARETNGVMNCVCCVLIPESRT